MEGVYADTLSLVIRNLVPDASYYFKVRARNSGGYGPESDTVIYTLKSGGSRVVLLFVWWPRSVSWRSCLVTPLSDFDSVSAIVCLVCLDEDDDNKDYYDEPLSLSFPMLQLIVGNRVAIIMVTFQDLS